MMNNLHQNVSTYPPLEVAYVLLNFQIHASHQNPIRIDLFMDDQAKEAKKSPSCRNENYVLYFKMMLAMMHLYALLKYTNGDNAFCLKHC